MIDLASVKPVIGGKSKNGILLFFISVLVATGFYLYMKYIDDDNRVFIDSNNEKGTSIEEKADTIDIEASAVEENED